MGAAEAAEVKEIADGYGIGTSWEGLATLAAMHQAAAAGVVNRDGSWIAVLTGDQAQLDLEETRAEDPPLPLADSEEELDRHLEYAAFTRADQG